MTWDAVSDVFDELSRELAGRYTVESELGRGGMALVFGGTDLRHDRKVAIKVLRPELASEVSAQRFLREIRVAARLQHPHILPLFDSGATETLRYYVMPFVSGESLRDRLNRDERLPLDDAVRVACQAADALGCAHAQGIVHRDVKPENILLDGYGPGAGPQRYERSTPGSGASWHALVADFGIARAVSESGPTDTLTRAGGVVGTPAYMSPEQSAGEGGTDGRSDIYSLGCVLFEMLAGRTPFAADSVIALHAAHLGTPPPDVSRLRRDVPRAVSEVIRVALAKSPDERFATAGEFAEALRAAAGDGTAPARARRRRRRSVLRALAGAAAVAALGAVGMAVARPTGRMSLTARDQVIVAEFENTTGDSAFDRSLVTALTVGLQESPRISVLPRAQIREVMTRAGRPTAADSLGESVAREVALRARARVVIVPAVARIDSTYVFSARVVDPSNGEDLATETVRVEGRARVLEGLDRLAARLRRSLGESLFARVQPRTPLDQATSASIDALKSYERGQQLWRIGNIAGAAASYAEAISLDSNFARAHAAQAAYYYWVNDRPNGERHAEAALAQLPRLPARERLWIQAYVAATRGNYESAVVAWRSYLTEYPYDNAARANLATALRRLNRCREALVVYDSVTLLDSMDANAHVNSAVCHAELGQPDSAVAEFRRAFALQPAQETSLNLNHEYGNTLVRAGQRDEARRVFQKMLTLSPDQQARGVRSLALLEMLGGRYDSAAALMTQAIAAARAANAPVSEARNLIYRAAAHRRLGRRAEERADLRDAYAILRRTKIEPAFVSFGVEALVASGEVAWAAELADTAARRARADNPRDRTSVEIARALVMLARGDPAGAVGALELAVKLDTTPLVLAPLARAYEAAGRPRDAEATYRRVVAKPEPGWERQEDWIEAHIALGRLAEARADTAAAIRWYDATLAIWRDAGDQLIAARAIRRRVEALRH